MMWPHAHCVPRGGSALKPRPRPRPGPAAGALGVCDTDPLGSGPVDGSHKDPSTFLWEET